MSRRFLPALALAWACDTGPSDTVRAHRIELVDEAGVVAGTLEASGGGARMTLGTAPSRTVELAATPQVATVSLSDGAGLRRASMTAAEDTTTLSLLGDDGAPRITLFASDQTSDIELRQADRDSFVRVSAAADGSLQIQLFGPGAKETAVLEVGDGGRALGPDLSLRDGEHLVVVGTQAVGGQPGVSAN